MRKVYRLQLQGELSAKAQTKRVYTGVFQGVSVILRNEGLRGLMAGLGAAVCYPHHVTPGPIRARSINCKRNVLIMDLQTVLLPSYAQRLPSRFL